MIDLQELYHDIILDHSKNPRYRTKPCSISCSSHGYNPLCGDDITVHLYISDKKIVDIGTEGSGCAISTAAASLVAMAVKGKTLTEVEDLFQHFHDTVTDIHVKIDEAVLGKLSALVGVREFPMRVKCATMIWHTLRDALSNENNVTAAEAE